jgi:zinc transport system ATP-binding protein
VQINNNNILTLTNVSYAYDSALVLEDINLDIEKGDYLAIMGPNGAGKTTLLKLMLGLLSPTKGSLCLCGEDSCSFTKRHVVGYVPQRASKNETSFPATVYEVVAMGRYKNRGIGFSLTKEDAVAIRGAISQMGMTAYTNTLLSELSGGQLQRVSIARALVHNPEILFLDEPMIGVDKATQEELYKILKNLNEEKNITIIFISHDVERMQKEAKRILYINNRVEFYGEASSFINTTLESNHHH